MHLEQVAALVAAGLILGRWLAELGLWALNRRHVLTHAGTIPEPYRATMDAATYARSVQYTLAKGRLAAWEGTIHTAVLMAVLFSGGLPRAWEWWQQLAGASVWATAGFLFAVGLGLSLAGLPGEWVRQFRVEQKFGFNTTTPRTWWLDRAKGLLLAVALGYPLLVLILHCVAWAGRPWWLWAAGIWIAFQVLLLGLGPAVIMPWFNRFSPLPDGPLRARLLALAARTGFRAQSIQVMDGSRRSQHANAFFTGPGRLRKIVLFDTLLARLTEPEVEAVLAHEIAHFKKKHILQRLVLSAVLTLAGFALVAWLAGPPWFARAFGFAPGGNIGPVLLVCALLAGPALFWVSPLFHGWSRRHEYEADAFAARAVGGAESLISGLRKLAAHSLSNLTPHPLYSTVYYTHPTLWEREQALARLGPPARSDLIGTASAPAPMA